MATGGRSAPALRSLEKIKAAASDRGAKARKAEASHQQPAGEPRRDVDRVRAQQPADQRLSSDRG
jgi:hypothetical protein